MSPNATEFDPQQQLVAALSQPAPRLYANGFVVAQSLSDITIVLQANGATVGVLNVSFTSAKSLGLNLLELVKTFEDATGQSLLTMSEILEKTGQLRPKDVENG